jgi:hypothetical protein
MSAKDTDAIQKLTIGCFLALFFMIGEMVGGYLSNSIAIFSDASHLLSDVAGTFFLLFCISNKVFQTWFLFLLSLLNQHWGHCNLFSFN